MKRPDPDIELEAVWRAARQEAEEFKDPWIILRRVSEFYVRLDLESRKLVDDSLSRWVLDTDDFRRAYGIRLVGDLEVRAAREALEELGERLRREGTQVALYELELVEQTRTELEGSSFRVGDS